MGGQYIEPMWSRAPADNTPSPSGASWAAPAWMARVVARLPGPCEVCRRWGPGALCGDCCRRFAPPVPRCQRCGLRTGTSLPACGECLRRPPPFEATAVAYDYAFPWDGLIGRFKFGAQPQLGRALATPLAAAIRAQRAAGEAPWPELVVPVPLAGPRLAERGYNQAWELARHLARNLGLPATADALVRTHDTAHQAGLDRRQRECNLRAAFMVAPRARAKLAGRVVALVDDVMTTGATAREAAAALRRAGASSVTLWVLARTPAPADAN